MKKIEAVIEWAYRQGYSYAEESAKEWCRLNPGRKYKIEVWSGGDYLKFYDA